MQKKYFQKYPWTTSIFFIKKGVKNITRFLPSSALFYVKINSCVNHSKMLDVTDFQKH